MPLEALEPGSKPAITKHGLFVILAATGLALLATPLVSPAMPEIARVFAQNAENEPFARAILSVISILPGDPSVIFLGQFSAPILVQPFIDPADPTAVWTAMSAFLMILAVVYAVLSRLGAKTPTE